MKKKYVLLVAFALISVFSSKAGNFITELENSIDRANKGSKVEYVLHFQNGKIKTITASDFKGGNLVSYKDRPLYFELYKGHGSKKSNIMINLTTPIYYKLDIEKVNGKWNYIFNFFY